MKTLFNLIIPLLFLTALLLNPPIHSQKSPTIKMDLKKTRDKIIEYIQKNKFRFRVEDLILLDYLQRRFSLSEEFSFKKTFTRYPDSQDIKSLEIYGRLVNYKGIKWKKPKQAESFIWLELQALFIEKQEECPDKNTLIMQLKRQSEEGGYASTHSALALGWFIEQKCLSPDDKDVQQAINDITRHLYSIATPLLFPSDLKVEALAFICYLGRKNLININEISHLFSFQRDDGSFSGTSVPEDGLNVHTTLLILWLALEFLNETTFFSEPMIPSKK